MVKFTDKAVGKFKTFLSENKNVSAGLRIFAAGGRWGPSLAMDIADGPGEGDVTLDKEGIKVFLEKEANKMLSEATIDYTAEQGIIISGLSRSSCSG